MKSTIILYTLVLLFVGSLITSEAQVKITDGAVLTLDPNSLLELESSNKGLLIPRMAINDLAQPSPLTAPVPTGMLVYSTGGAVADGFYFWSGAAWTIMATGTGSQWTTSGANIYYNAGNVGIGAAVPAERLDVVGNIKLGNATTGTIRATRELVLQQDGDVYGSSILRLRNRTTENGAIFETTDPTTTLIDFIFKNAANQRNIRFESRATYARTGGPSFHIGGLSPDDPALSLGDNYSAFSNKLKIGDYILPTALLHLRAGTAAAGTAPLKFTSGSLLTTAEPGAIEFLADRFYGTITTGAARRTFAFLESPVFTGSISAPVLTSTVATGTAPLTVTSTTPVANLNIGGNAENVNGIVATGNGGTGLSAIGTASQVLAVNSAGTGYTHRSIKQQIGQWGVVNLGRNLNNSQLTMVAAGGTNMTAAGSRMQMAFNGVIIGVVVSTSAPCTAGTATFSVFTNGNPTTVTADINSTTNTQFNATNNGSESFSAGDILDIRVTTNGTYTPNNSVEVAAWIIIEWTN